MRRFLRRWLGLRCWFNLCGGKVGTVADGGVCWRCSECWKEIE